MLKAKDFKFYAREALKGRWLSAGGTALVAGLLGASIGTQVSISNPFGNYETEELANLGAGGISSEISGVLIAVLVGLALVILLWAVVSLVIGGASTIGYAKYNLHLVDDQEAKLGDVVSEYDRLGVGFGMKFFTGLYTLLWSMLFVIPGIMAAYSYFLAPFILAENPEMKSRDAIRESKELMKGNRWRLFCLQLSFIGWTILAAFGGLILMAFTIVPFAMSGTVDSTVLAVIAALLVVAIYIVILNFLLVPYMQAANAVFYREIKDGKYSNPTVEGVAEEYSYEAMGYSYESVE